MWHIGETLYGNPLSGNGLKGYEVGWLLGYLGIFREHVGGILAGILGIFGGMMGGILGVFCQIWGD